MSRAGLVGRNVPLYLVHGVSLRQMPLICSPLSCSRLSFCQQNPASQGHRRVRLKTPFPGLPATRTVACRFFYSGWATKGVSVQPLSWLFLGRAATLTQASDISGVASILRPYHWNQSHSLSYCAFILCQGFISINRYGRDF